MLTVQVWVTSICIFFAFSLVSFHFLYNICQCERTTNPPSEEQRFYEFCSPEKTYPIVFPAINKTLWLLSYDNNGFFPNELVFLALYEDHKMEQPDARIQVASHPDLDLVQVEIYDKIEDKFLSCSLRIFGEQNTIHCPTSPARRFSGPTESLYVRGTDIFGNSKTTLVSLCKQNFIPTSNVSLCVAFIHNLDGLTSRIVEYIEYHRLIGINHFVLYFRSTAYLEQLRSIYPPEVLTGSMINK
jgi:hypothetical protein